MARTFCRSCSVSRSSRACRSAHRACASRSSHPWHGWARRARRRVASSGSSTGAAARPPPLASAARRCRCCAATTPGRGAPAGPGGRRRLGSRIRPSGSTGAGKSAADSRPAQRSSLSTSGRGSPSASDPGVEHHGEPGPPAARHRDHVAGAQRAQRVGRGLAPLRHALAGDSAFSRSADPPAQRGVLGEVAEVALHRRWRSPARASTLRSIRRARPDHRPVGLELPERLLQQLPRGFGAEAADEVDGHVVAGAERAAQRVGAGGGQPGDLLGVDPGLPDDDRVALDVDAPPARPGPVSCVYSPGVSSAWDSPLNLTSRSSTTVRAGMLMPSARVSVANTARTSPRTNSSSTVSLNAGSIPAWCAAMPRSSASRHSQ